MAQMGRPGLSAGEKKELWRRWKDGQTLSEIGIALGKHAGSVHGVLRARGGIAPVTRSRAARSLSSADREEISRGLVAGLSLRKIAEQLEPAPSTVSRELARNGGPDQYRGAQARGKIVDAVSIRKRPGEGDDRADPGHWEGAILAGSKNSHIATLVERRSRFVLLVRVRGKDTTNVVDALVRQVKTLPQGLMSSLTWDRGTELAQHKRFSVSTDVKVYFCDPSSPWQR